VLLLLRLRAMAYWFDESVPDQPIRRGRGRGPQVSDTKPVFFENESDVALHYPPLKATATVRRKKQGGENVARRASQDDKTADQMVMLRE
jgi:hypothetical protein